MVPLLYRYALYRSLSAEVKAGEVLVASRLKSHMICNWYMISSAWARTSHKTAICRLCHVIFTQNEEGML